MSQNNYINQHNREQYLGTSREQNSKEFLTRKMASHGTRVV